jgi:hypothetical protein
MMGGDVFPRDEPRSTKSAAEVLVWRALRKHLPVGWKAWHSLRCRSGSGWEGEGDFVIAAPDRGLLVLEVKGGNIELRGGHWFQNGVRMKKPPRDQAQSYVRRLAEAIVARGAERPPFGVACAFPDVDFSDDTGPRAGDLDGLVLGARHFDWLEQSLPPLLARAVPKYAMPRDDRWITALHELWGETWVPSLNLVDAARASEERLVGLVDDQLQVLAAVEDNPRAYITGGAGTGKTLLARELCARAAASGKRVLYLCFTDALGLAVERAFEPAQRAGGKVRAMPIRRFAATLLEAGGVAPSESSEFWNNASLTAACEALPPVEDRPELVVVDEAQDLEDGDWDLVNELVGQGALWILGDERQAFWRRSPIPEGLTRGAVRIKLRAQHRNPSAIAALAARYCEVAPLARGSEPTIAPGGAGHESIRLVEVAAGTELERLKAEIAELVRAGARPQDIAIVTLAGLSVSQLLKQDQLGPHRLVRADSRETETNIVADTFLRFKGLERPFVFLVEIGAGHASQYDVRMHIAITRATSRLIVLGTQQDIDRDERIASLRMP